MIKKGQKRENILVIWSCIILLCGIITIVSLCISNYCFDLLKLSLMELLSNIIDILGVFATIELGCVAILQTKYYQEESTKNSNDRTAEINKINNQFLDIQKSISNILQQTQEMEENKRIPHIRIFNCMDNLNRTYKFKLENIDALDNLTLRIQNLSPDIIISIKVTGYKINNVEYPILEEEKRDFPLDSDEVSLIELFIVSSKDCLIEMQMEVENVLGEIYIIEYDIKATVVGNKTIYTGNNKKRPYLKVI